MKYLGFNFVIVTLIIAPIINLGIVYNDAAAESKVTRHASEKLVVELIINSTECGYEVELEEYLGDDKITYDEANSLLALCEYNAHAKANDFLSKRRLRDAKIKRDGGLKI